MLTGSGLQLGSVFGQNPIIGGGSTAWATPASRSTGSPCWSSSSGWRPPGVRVARRRRLALVVLAAALAVEALPSLGADFGGPPGLLLGGLLVVATAAGVRLTWRRVLAAVVGAGALVALVAVPDWLRPADVAHPPRRLRRVGGLGGGRRRGRAQARAEPRQPRLTAPARHRRRDAGARRGARRVRWRPVPDGVVVLGGAVVMAVVGVPGQRLRARHPGVRRARAGASARGGRSFAPGASGGPGNRSRVKVNLPGSGGKAVTQWVGSVAGSTSSTRMPRASLGWMKFTRELLVPRLASG